MVTCALLIDAPLEKLGRLPPAKGLQSVESLLTARYICICVCLCVCMSICICMGMCMYIYM